MNTNLAMLFFLIAPVALISLILVLAYFEKWGGWYFFALILSVIWLLLPVLPTQLSGLFGGPTTPLGQTADDFQQGIASWYGMPLFLICSTFIMYFWCGTKATVSKSGAINVIKSQKTVWTALAIVFFALSTWATSLYLDISPRVDGLTATSRDLGNTYKLLHHDAESIVDQLQNKDKAPSISNVHYLLEQFDSQISLTLSLIEQRQKEIEALTTSSDHLSRIPSLASSAVTSLTVPLWTWQELQGLKQAKILITNIRETAKQGDPLTHSGAYSTDNNYTQFWESHLLTQTDDLASLANTTQPDERTPLILTLALMMVFVLFPWLLCISFIVSKRATVVRDNRITLQRLGLIKRIIHSSGSRGNFVESADRQRARDLINLHEELNKSGPNGVPTQLIQRFKDISALIPEDSTLCELFERLRSFFRSYESCISLGSSSNTNEEERQLSMRHLNWLVRSAINRSTEIIIEQRSFASREYILPLLLLTLFMTVGWYHIFFPQESYGMVLLIMAGPNIHGVTQQITESVTPISMAFLGAWLHVNLILTYRWGQDDLLPRSYMLAAIRLITAIVVGFVFIAIFRSISTDGVSYFPWATLLIAFIVGIFPTETVRSMIRVANGVSGSWIKALIKILSIKNSGIEAVEYPDIIGRYPLTKLEEMTIWSEGRFSQEGIDDIRSLALCNLETIVLNTPFSSQALMDWIDQSILWVYVGEHQPIFKAASIRRATQLIAILDEDSSSKRYESSLLQEYLVGSGTASTIKMANSQPVVTNPPKDENPLYNKNQIPSDTHTDSVPILTNEKLSIILRAIDEDCNIKYLKRFWNGKPNDAPENKAKQKATIQGVGEN